MITDCHIHIQPPEMFRPEVRLKMAATPEEFARIAELAASPATLLRHLDEIGVERAVLIGCVAPEVMGTGPEINPWLANYVKADPQRLLMCGSVNPRHSQNVEHDLRDVLAMGARMIKIHPPHQLFAANDYASDYANGADGLGGLATIYRICEAEGIPVMVHTGTSIFAGARNRFADPMPLDDVAVDFPQLKLIMAHGGRPLYMDTAFFLLRRHSNLYFDISSIPPKKLLEYFPRLEEIAHKSLFGSDWAGPGIRGIGQNLDDFRALPLSEAAQQRILSGTALEIWPQ